MRSPLSLSDRSRRKTKRDRYTISRNYCDRNLGLLLLFSERFKIISFSSNNKPDCQLKVTIASRSDDPNT